MAEHPPSNFRLLDEPSSSSVAILADTLRDQSAGGLISPKAYAHRSRVVRQQMALLKLRQAQRPNRERGS